jgi:ABC-2 type transport system ATP-binding protein
VSATAVRFDRVRKVYRRGLFGRRTVQALRGVTLDVPTGAVFGLLGPNRAGKTTLVKSLLSLCRITGGSIERLGRPAADRATLARVGYLHESQAFPRYLNAAELLDYHAALAFVSRADRRTRVPRLLERVGLADRLREPIGGYSKGMVQRLALAQALVNDPELLVLDEPTEGLDLLARRLLHEVIVEHRRRGRTTLLVSHSLADVESLCDAVAVLNHGELAFAGPIEDLSGDRDVPATDSLAAALEPLYAGATA